MKRLTSFLFCLFLLGTEILYSQNYIYTPQDFANMVPNGSYILMDDITVTQMYTQTFTGQFNGNNKKITVQINENITNVGLFSQIDGNGRIDSLIVDGYVIGGQNSQYVGGIVGEVIYGMISNCTNLADVIGESAMSSVGGIVGAVNGDVVIHQGINNGINGRHKFAICFWQSLSAVISSAEHYISSDRIACSSTDISGPES
ncbi:MAG: hypothetical protein FWG85_06860 [Bacteroidetes bacterium]|nr:hypothetical protein [Bacteroidota bacterium]